MSLYPTAIHSRKKTWCTDSDKRFLSGLIEVGKEYLIGLNHSYLTFGKLDGRMKVSQKLRNLFRPGW